MWLDNDGCSMYWRYVGELLYSDVGCRLYLVSDGWKVTFQEGWDLMAWKRNIVD